MNKSKETALHIAAWKGHVDFTKLLIQNDADVNVLNKHGNTALYEAKKICKLLLICCGAKIGKKAIKDDRYELLLPINDKLNLLRDGKRIGTSLMVDEEKRFMWNLAFSFTIAHGGASAFKLY